jgi:acetyltransferase-like isoleucine patch superfamily enzyme
MLHYLDKKGLMLILTRDKLDKLNELGFNLDGHTRHVPEDLIFESPSSLKRVEIGPKVEIGAFSYMVSGYLFATKIGRYCSFGEDVQIGRQNHPVRWISTSPFLYRQGSRVANFSKEFVPYLNDDKFVYPINPTIMKKTIIDNDVYIGHGAIINTGVHVGSGAIIASGSVVTKDVPAYSIVGGNPAQFIRWRFDEQIIKKLLSTEWWSYTPKQLQGLPLHEPEKFINDFNLRKLEKITLPKIKINDIYSKDLR